MSDEPTLTLVNGLLGHMPCVVFHFRLGMFFLNEVLPYSKFRCPHHGRNAVACPHSVHMVNHLAVALEVMVLNPAVQDQLKALMNLSCDLKTSTREQAWILSDLLEKVPFTDKTPLPFRGVDQKLGNCRLPGGNLKQLAAIKRVVDVRFGGAIRAGLTKDPYFDAPKTVPSQPLRRSARLAEKREKRKREASK